VRIRIVCDNSKCKKDVDKFVFKWYCLTTNRDLLEARNNQPGITNKSKSISRFDFPGCRSGEKIDRTIEINAPLPNVPSIQVSLFTIGYIIQC